MVLSVIGGRSLVNGSLIAGFMGAMFGGHRQYEFDLITKAAVLFVNCYVVDSKMIVTCHQYLGCCHTSGYYVFSIKKPQDMSLSSTIFGQTWLI